MNDSSARSTQTTYPNLKAASWDEPTDWYPDDISQLMLLTDNMDIHAYEIRASFKELLLGKQVRADNGRTGILVDISSFEIDLEEYMPALQDENALNAKMAYHVDGKCEVDGVKSDVSKLPVWFDFQYINHNTGYTISQMTIDC